MTKYLQNKKISKKNSKDKKNLTSSRTKEVEDPEFTEWKEMIFRECDLCPFGCLVVTKESKIEKANENAANLFKFDLNELIGNDINILVPPDLRKDHYELVSGYFKRSRGDYYERVLTGYTKNDKILSVNVGLMTKKFKTNIDKVYALAFLRIQSTNNDPYLILPDNPFYIGWILFMFISITLSMILLPYETVFNQAEENMSMSVFIYATTALDMLFNFNCAFVENENVVTDRLTIVKNYLMGYFLIDLQTGLPVEFFTFVFTNISDSSIMILKMLRSIKLIKYYSALTNDYMIELLSHNPIFKKFKQISNRYYLYYEFILLLCNYLVTIHFLTSFFILICTSDPNESNWLYKSGIFNDSGLKLIYKGNYAYVFDKGANNYLEFDYRNGIGNNLPDPKTFIYANPFKSYIIAYYEIASAFLMFKSLNPTTTFEYVFSTFVNYYGLLCIAYTIGRCSELLTENYKDNFQYQRIYAVIYSICSDTALSGNLVDNMLKEITNNYEVFNETKSHLILQSSIPMSMYNLMITEYYKTYIDSHKLLKKLPCGYYNILERYSKPCLYNILFEREENASKLFFITMGEVNLYDANNKLCYEYEENMVVGFREFQYFITKNVNLGYIKYENSANPVKSIDSTKSTAKQFIVKNQNSRYNYTAKVSPHSRIFSLSFQILEDLISKDKNLYNIFEDYIVDSSSSISRIEHTYTKNEMLEFENNEDIGFVFLPNGLFYAVNKSFNKIFSMDMQVLQNYTFYDLFKNKDGKSKLDALMKLENGRYMLTILEQDLDVDLNFYFKTIVIEKDRVVDGKKELVKVVRETCFVYCRMINSVKAFLIGKQKAVKQIDEIEKISMYLERNEEEDMIEQQKQAELYEMMIYMAENKVDMRDIKHAIHIDAQQKINDANDARKKKNNARNNKLMAPRRAAEPNNNNNKNKNMINDKSKNKNNSKDKKIKEINNATNYKELPKTTDIKKSKLIIDNKVIDIEEIDIEDLNNIKK